MPPLNRWDVLWKYYCEWDTDELLGWDEVFFVLEQLGLIAEEKQDDLPAIDDVLESST